MSSGTGVSVSLHAAGTAPAAPAPSAGPHTARRAAGVRARLTHCTTLPLCSALPSNTRRTRTCWTSTRPVRLKPSVELVKQQRTVTGRPPFCLRGLSALGPDFGASDLVLLQQRFLLWVPLMLRSPVFQSGSFSLSGITTTLCSGALGQ